MKILCGGLIGEHKKVGGIGVIGSRKETSPCAPTKPYVKFTQSRTPSKAGGLILLAPQRGKKLASPEGEPRPST